MECASLQILVPLHLCCNIFLGGQDFCLIPINIPESRDGSTIKPTSAVVVCCKGYQDSCFSWISFVAAV